MNAVQAIISRLGGWIIVEEDGKKRQTVWRNPLNMGPIALAV